MLPCGFFFWWIGISLVAVIVTVWDKRAAKRSRRRVRESTLLGIGALGGAAAMLLTMRVIRHKTLKPKFTVGLPMLMLLHLVLAVGAWLLMTVQK